MVNGSGRELAVSEGWRCGGCHEQQGRHIGDTRDTKSGHQIHLRLSDLYRWDFDNFRVYYVGYRWIVGMCGVHSFSRRCRQLKKKHKKASFVFFFPPWQ